MSSELCTVPKNLNFRTQIESVTVGADARVFVWFSGRFIDSWRCGGSKDLWWHVGIALQTPGPGSIPASRTVENNENKQSHCVYFKISVKLERNLHLRKKNSGPENCKKKDMYLSISSSSDRLSFLCGDSDYFCHSVKVASNLGECRVSLIGDLRPRNLLNINFGWKLNFFRIRTKDLRNCKNKLLN